MLRGGRRVSGWGRRMPSRSVGQIAGANARKKAAKKTAKEEEAARLDQLRTELLGKLKNPDPRQQGAGVGEDAEPELVSTQEGIDRSRRATDIFKLADQLKFKAKVPLGGGRKGDTSLEFGGQGANFFLQEANKLLEGFKVDPSLDPKPKKRGPSFAGGRRSVGADKRTPQSKANTLTGALGKQAEDNDAQIEKNRIRRERTVAFTNVRSKQDLESQRISNLILTGRRRTRGSVKLPRGLALLGQKNSKVL